MAISDDVFRAAPSVPSAAGAARPVLIVRDIPILKEEEVRAAVSRRLSKLRIPIQTVSVIHSVLHTLLAHVIFDDMVSHAPHVSDYSYPIEIIDRGGVNMIDSDRLRLSTNA